jgi:PleD family two-component response regulator
LLLCRIALRDNYLQEKNGNPSKTTIGIYGNGVVAMEGEKILIAEAEQKITELASVKLSNAGYLIFSVAGNESVLERAAQVHPDLFLIGNDLPIKSGLEICYTLRMDPLFSATPIILIVDSEFDQSQLEHLRFKIDGILVKPFTPKNLLQKVNENMTRYRLIQQVNPQTLLPSKVHLINAVNTLIDGGAGFELVFSDLKNFSVYNKIYGYEKGDAVIRFTAGILREALHQDDCPLGELYHLGGDDFAILTQEGFDESFLQQIIEVFQEGIVKYYSDEDVRRGDVFPLSREVLADPGLGKVQLVE